MLYKNLLYSLKKLASSDDNNKVLSYLLELGAKLKFLYLLH